MSNDYRRVLELIGASESDFITPNQNISMLDAIDADAMDIILKSQVAIYRFTFDPVQLEKNLSEAITLLDRCIDNRKAAYILREAHFSALMRYYKSVKHGELTKDEIQAGLLKLGKEIADIEKKTITERSNTLKPLLPEEGVDPKPELTNIELTRIQAEIYDLSAKLDSMTGTFNLEEIREKTQAQRIKLIQDYEKAMYERLGIPHSPTNYMQRYEIVKKNFNLDLAGAYFRLESVKTGVKLIGIDEDTHGLGEFPFIGDEPENMLDSLSTWTRKLIIAMQHSLKNDQDIVIRASLSGDCLTPDGSDYVVKRDDNIVKHIKFKFPDYLFDHLKYVRLRGITVGSYSRSWRMTLEPPPIDQPDFQDNTKDRKIYLGRVLPFEGGGTGARTQIFRGAALHNLNPKGVWKLNIIGKSLCHVDPKPFTGIICPDIFFDLHLSAIVGE
jgi:hypothetical protein